MDGGWEFQNEKMTGFMEKWGIQLKFTASESPWGNGKCGKVVGLLKEMMRKLKEEGVKRKEFG